MSKLTISPYWNTELVPDKANEGKHRLYYKISFNRNNTKIKSEIFEYLTKKEFEEVRDSKELSREVSLLTRIMEIETNDLELKLQSFKGFKEKIRLYMKGVDEVYKAYGLRLIEQQLMYRVDKMNDRELLIYSELDKLLPMKEYLLKQGKNYDEVHKNPHAFCLLIYGYLSQFTLTENEKVLSEIKQDIDYYMKGLDSILGFYESKYLKVKSESLIIHWMSYDMKKQFANYLNEKYSKEPKSRLTSIFSLTPHIEINILSKSTRSILTKVELGLMHSNEFLLNIARPNIEGRE